MLVTQSALHTALHADQMVPFFQPQIDLRTGTLLGFEVLARWQHPVLGPILPAGLIELAEHHQILTPLTHQVFRKAFLAALLLPAPMRIAVNISVKQLECLNFAEQLNTLAEQTGFDLSRLTIEITEGVLLGDLELSRAATYDLKALGCKLSMDDFGTGYSSMYHLQALSFDELNIDRKFIASMSDDRGSRKIVAAMIGLGYSLGLNTVGEGVETEEQRATLQRLGCNVGQGWLHGRPMPEEKLAEFCRTCCPDHRDGAFQGRDIFGLDALPAQRLAELEAIYNGAPVGLCFLDTKLRFVSLNQRLADFNGFPVRSHLGRDVREMIGKAFVDYEPYFNRALKGESIAGVVVMRSGASPGDPDRVTLASYQPVRDDAGEVVGISIALVDISSHDLMRRTAIVSGRYRRKSDRHRLIEPAASPDSEPSNPPSVCPR